MSDASRNWARQAALQALEDLYQAGVTHLPKRTSCKPPVQGRQTDSSPATRTVSPAVPEIAPATAGPLSRDDRIVQLSVLQKQVSGCTRCDELAATRTQTVFGVGNPQPRLCFMGEAPGADEDARGEPFVGKAGQLLTRIIEACGMKREDVYILNTIKCRPPGNRTPLPHEVTNCSEYLDRQLEILQPEFICCLGLVAAQALLKTDSSMGRLRGKFYDYAGIPVLCTYHPAYLLRNPAAKKDVWEDMKLLLGKMGLKVPSAKAE